MFPGFVVSYYSINIYEILVIQDKKGELISIKIEEYEPERTKNPEYFWDDEILH